MTAALRPADSAYATRLFGTIDVPPTAIIDFPEGIPGFPDARQFAQLAAPAPALSWLQSLDLPALAFLLVRWDVMAEPVSDEGETYAIVTLPRGDQAATANLQAPVFIDRVGQSGRQMIRSDATPGTAVPFDLEALIRTS